MEVDFPIEYFRPEIRDGFYVDGMMKRVWAASLKIMVGRFDEVCRKYGLHWFADSGTLLGAVRHDGYIPWDDDLDVRMLRDDYNKFKEIMYDELPEYGFLVYDNPDNSGNNNDLLTRVISTANGWNIEPEFLKKYCDCPFPAGLDIFPMDFIPDDPEEAREYWNLCHLLIMGVSIREGYKDIDNEYASMIMNGIEKGTGYHFNDKESIETQCIRLSEAVFSMYHRDECSRVVSIWAWAETENWENGIAAVYPKEWFMHPQKHKFENTYISISAAPEKYLAIQFGKNYMTPIRDANSHGYPFYKGMEQSLIGAIGYDPFYYHISETSIKIIKEDRLKLGKKTDGKDILFIVPKATDWKYLDFYYKKLKADSKNRLTVMPIPFYDCDLLKEPKRVNYEINDFPEELNTVSYMSVNINERHYDEIIISFPYDQYDYTEMIEEKYFAVNLREQTDKLVYISPFFTDDNEALSGKDQIAMKHYVTVPGVIYADRVFVQSEKMKKAYITRLINSWKDECEDNESLGTMTSEHELGEILAKKIKVSEPLPKDI